MKENTLNKIIYILVGIAIGLLILFIVKNIMDNKKKDDSEVVEYSDPVEYFSEVENTKDENKLKKGFTNIVDFLFYGKEINGKTFNELKDDAKLKIIKIAFSIDSKIDEKIPAYKNKISEKYQNIKSKVVELYVNTTTKICTNNEQLCIDAKNDFASLKESFGITFDYLKKYGIKGLDKLKEWYEDFRD